MIPKARDVSKHITECKTKILEEESNRIAKLIEEAEDYSVYVNTLSVPMKALLKDKGYSVRVDGQDHGYYIDIPKPSKPDVFRPDSNYMGDK